MSKLLLLFVFFSLLASQWLLVEGVQTSKDDLAYLRRFAAATGADQALGWHVGSDPCEDRWSGVDCDEAGKVIFIDVQGKGLTGIMPDAAENTSLSSLEELRLGGNAFTGTLPILPLPKLWNLGLDSNSFTRMPNQFFVGMPRLRSFNISNNSALARWTLSKELHSLTQLDRFEASHAGISGTLDAFLSNGTAFPFPNLVWIYLSANRLSGQVPEIKGSRIVDLDLSNNLLSGSISFIRGLASSVEHLKLSHNKFTGLLPDFTGFTLLALLSVDHNQITGVVPSSLPRLEAINSVSLSGNLLQGPLPEFRSDVQTDVAKAAARGSFCRLDRGPCDPEVECLLVIAAALGYPKSFAASWLRNDTCAGWNGIHCDDRRRVTGINLSRLGLSGTMDPAFGLSGTMDPAFGSLRSLEVIFLSHKNITGEIPASVAQLPALQVLDVTSNNLVGMIPKFRDDVSVWIEGNPRLKLSGSSLSRPSTVGLLVALAVLPLFLV